MPVTVHDLIFLFIAGCLFAESEKINRNAYKLPGHSSVWFPFFAWWTAKNYKYSNPLINWLMKYILAPFKDGFHFTKGAAIWILVSLIVGWNLYYTLICFAILGAGFNLNYHLYATFKKVTWL